MNVLDMLQHLYTMRHCRYRLQGHRQTRSCNLQERDAQELAAYVEQARATPRGHKKDYSGDMPKAYDPKIVEAATYVWMSYMRSAEQVCAVAPLQTCLALHEAS